MKTQNFFEWMVDHFTNDGFDVFISYKLMTLVVSIKTTLPPYYQVSRDFPFGSDLRDVIKIYWDLSTSIRRKERYAESRQQRMAT